VTAWVALTGHRRVTAGDTVLTQGSGGVSVFALQLARVLGARVIATTSTAEKAERLKAGSFGCDQPQARAPRRAD
jgi:NADPH:quinone reductase-like Zn-dependent oxidoreductase